MTSTVRLLEYSILANEKRLQLCRIAKCFKLWHHFSYRPMYIVSSHEKKEQKMLENTMTVLEMQAFNKREEQKLHLLAKGYEYSMISQIFPVTYSMVQTPCRAIRNRTGLAKCEYIVR